MICQSESQCSTIGVLFVKSVGSHNGDNNICVVNLVEADNLIDLLIKGMFSWGCSKGEKDEFQDSPVANCIEPKLLDRVQLQLFFKILLQYIL
jgi:hypothetical protein